MSQENLVRNISQSAVENLQANAISIGDINQTVNQYLQKVNHFIKRENLDEFKHPLFPSVIGVDKMISILLSRRVIIIGGSHEDKSEISIYLAFRLSQRYSSQANTTGVSEKGFNIWEFDCNSDSQVPLTDISEQDNNSLVNLYILKNLRPRAIDFRFKEIIHKATESNSYIVATTNIPRNQWVLDTVDRNVWIELGENLYIPESITSSLISKLDYSSQEIDSTCITPKVKEYLSKIATKKIRNFSSLSRCVRLLSAQKEEPSQEEISEIIHKAQDSKSSLKEWYQVIDDREKLLSIGLSLFDGLFEDQFFAALEQIVINVWQRRDPSLRALDYYDLKNFGNHFRFEYDREYTLNLRKPKVLELNEYAKKIRVLRSRIIRSEERSALIEIAWENYRRQIFSALKVIVELIENSALDTKETQKNWELYGDAIRREKLRDVLGETLGNLCLVAATDTTGAVQGALLQLAMNDSFEVRQVSAQAIAYWYKEGYKYGGKNRKTIHEGVLGTLQRFYNEALSLEESINGDKQELGGISSKLKEEPIKGKEISKENNVSIFDFLKFFRRPNVKELGKEEYYFSFKPLMNRESNIASTVALAVGYASQSDYSYASNRKISKILLQWLDELLQSRLALVHWTLGEQTLHEVIPKYVGDPEINNFLKRAIQTHQHEFLLNKGIALSLAKAYSEPSERLEYNRLQIKKNLDDWYSECKEQRGEAGKNQKVKYHDALLKVIALTYGWLEYDDQPTIDVKEGLRKLNEILETEKHPLVRQSVILSVCKLIYSYFDVIHPDLKTILSNAVSGELNDIADIISRLHKSQLDSLQNIGKVRVDGISYNIWVSTETVLDSDESHEIIAQLKEMPLDRIRHLPGKYVNKKLREKSCQICLHMDQPLTKVKETIFPWLKDEVNPVLQRVALKVFSNLSKESVA